MYHITERNERKARTNALVLAIGLHLSLGLLLYSQMSASPSKQTALPAKVNMAKQQSAPMPKVVSERP